jgi:hypothetical protein
VIITKGCGGGGQYLFCNVCAEKMLTVQAKRCAAGFIQIRILSIGTVSRNGQLLSRVALYVSQLQKAVMGMGHPHRLVLRLTSGLGILSVTASVI